MIQTSEYCTVGHPDRTCDFIASYILDRYLMHDSKVRFALEVQLKNNFCTVSGEVTSDWQYGEADIARFVREAINEIGYTQEYQREWGRGNTICGDEVEVVLHLSQQSPDIAQGVEADGWGDQGIFWGLAVCDSAVGNMPLDYFLARAIGNELYSRRLGGLDIKTMVTIDGVKPVECVIAIPLKDDADQQPIIDLARMYIGDECEIIVNGTGRYVTHGSIGDCGTTGRKLVVDFYGGNSRIGGGNTWGKDPSKADVSLNYYAREKALKYMREHDADWIQCSISCCIGRPELRITYFDQNNNQLATENERIKPSEIIAELGLRYPGYGDRCKFGMFGYEDE